MPNQVSFTTPFSAEAESIARQRRLAEALQAQSMQPLETNQTAGGYVIPVSPFQGLAKMLQAYSGRKGIDAANEAERGLAGRRNQALADALSSMPQARTQDMNPVAVDDEGNTMPQALKTTQPTMQDNAAFMSRLAQIDPSAVQIGGTLLGMQQKAQENQATREATAADKAATREFMSADRAAAREQRMQELQLRLADARTTAQDRIAFQRELAQMRIDAQREMQSMRGQGMGAQPYFTPVQTAQGVMAFNARTGRMEPVQVGGQAVVGSQSDPNLQGSLAQAKAGGKERGETVAKTQLQLPQTIATAEQASSIIDQMIGSRDGKTPAHKGFSSTVGMTWLPGARLIEGTPQAGFMALMDQVRGGAFLQAFNSLKGGGQITEAEGKKATDAITRMSKSQSEAEFIKAAREYQDVISNGVKRARAIAGGASGAPAQPASVLDQADAILRGR